MMQSSMRSRAAAVAAALLTASSSVAGCAGSKPPERAATAAVPTTHPEVDTGLDSCAGCHEQVTPRATAQWKDGRHGMALVECFVCHGSTGTDFKARPAPSACRSCHPSEWASSTRGGATRSCFDCHPAHALRAQGKASPHVASSTKEGRP